jgi:metal-dependent amidase/aminoacylase/carboxypeptidase family protein
VTSYQSIAQLRQHIRNTDRIHGIITEGGLAPNIVPERAACRFYVRAVDAHELAPLKARVQKCFEAGALATGCTLEVHWGDTDYLDLKTNWPMAEMYERNAIALGREFFPVKDLPPGYAGSTDMGNVSHRVPSIHPMLGVAPAGVIIHNPEFTRYAASEAGDQAVIDGAKSLAMTALDLMADPAMLAQARADFAATAELSQAAIARSREPMKHDHHGHGGCGCT